MKDPPPIGLVAILLLLAAVAGIANLQSAIVQQSFRNEPNPIKAETLPLDTSRIAENTSPHDEFGMTRQR